MNDSKTVDQYIANHIAAMKGLEESITVLNEASQREIKALNMVIGVEAFQRFIVNGPTQEDIDAISTD